jgi:eukaryotic-like serine/threonine-protein kinase
MRQQPVSRIVRFGSFEVDLQDGRLTKAGIRIRLQEQPFQILTLLLERPGQVVTREEIRQELWSHDTFVEFDDALNTAVRKLRAALNDSADTPRFLETVPRRGYRFVAPVSIPTSGSPDPTKDVSVIGSPASQTTRPVPAASRISLNRTHYWVAVALSILLVGGAAYLFRPTWPRPAKANASPATMPARRSVAVLGFRNLPKRAEEDWLSTALAEMLSTELAAGGSLRLISGEDVARAKKELPLADAETLAKATLTRLRQNPGADVVVVGSYTPMEQDGRKYIRLDVRLQDTITGETISEDAFTEPEEHLFDLASQAGVRLRQSLRVDPISASAMSGVRASLPSNQQAARLYAEGRDRLWEYDFLAARDLLVKAVAADPNYPLSHSALASAWSQLGYEAKSQAEAKRALELSHRLPDEERLQIEGQYWQTMGDWPKSVEADQRLFELFPDSLDYGLRLAAAQLRVKPKDSLRTLASLRRLPPPESDDPRIDMNEASAWVTLDFKKAEVAAKRAIEKASDRGSHFLVARTYGILCQQLAYTGGSTEEAIRDCERARQSYVAAGHRNAAARTLNDLAIIYAQQGDLIRAKAIWREGLQTFRQIGDVQGAAGALNNLGEALLLEGDLTEAKKMLEEAIPSYQTADDKDGVGRVLNDLGDLLWERGDLEVAKTTYQQSIATAKEIDDKSVIASALTGLGDILTDEGDLTEARKSYQDSLALRNQLSEKQTAAETQVALANLSIEESHAAEGEAALRKSKQQFHEEQEVDDELTASAVLARSLLAQGKRSEANSEIRGSEALASKCQRRLPRLRFALTSARVLLVSDEHQAAKALLQSILKEASARGFAGPQFEARLALGELEQKSGRTAAAQAQLISLEKAAHTKGFGLIARKAAAARS